MARPRSFDTDAVLDAAQDLFWSRGYQAASLDELTRVTGVNKPSLYAALVTSRSSSARCSIATTPAC
jgi:TetR/AcrR family transcriptional regulator, transcriptional repressor for nem operon